MATIKSYTDLQQSKKLAEILPIESADMCINSTNPYMIFTEIRPIEGFDEEHDPCWSLATLLDIIPYPTLGKHADETWSCASWVEKVSPYFVEGCDSPISACYEMILKLHEYKFM